jgi:hypothetical protein
MLITYKTITTAAHRDEYGLDKPEQVHYDKGAMEVCCEDMQEVMDESYVVFDWHDATVSIGLAKTDDYEGLPHSDYVLKFCPFCGARVQLKEVGKVHRSPSYTEHVQPAVTRKTIIWNDKEV